MRSLTRGRCFRRQIHATSDMELQNEANDMGNERESVEALVAVAVEPTLLNGTHDLSLSSVEPGRGHLLESNMQSLIRSRCLQRQIHATSDNMEMQSKATDLGNERESVEALDAVTVEPSLLNVTHDSSLSSVEPGRGNLLEVFLSFYYYIGVSPFRVDCNRNLRSTCINKMLSILITLVAITYIVFSVRTLAWLIDEPNISQQVKASSYIGLVYYFCSLVLGGCVFRMMWCKQEAFLNFFCFKDISDIVETLKSSLVNLLVISICSLSILIPLVSTVGGLSLMDGLQTWSFFEILSHHEINFLLGLKKSWDYTDSNDTSRIGLNATKEDDNGGIFLSDGHLETIIFGGTGMVVDFCQQVFSLFSHDWFLLSTITLWIYTEQLRDQLKVWGNRIRGNNLDCQIASRNIADDIVKEYKELSLLSKHINTITNSFLPALVMANIITMSYFMYNLVNRKWFFALNLSLKLYKTWVAIYFAMKTSKVAEGYYSWFISEDVRESLDLSVKTLQYVFAEMKGRSVGIGSGVFYIDTKFLLSSLGVISTYFYMVTGTGT